MAQAKRSHGAGTVRQLPSGRWQARLRTPDGKRISAPQTFDTKLDAKAWLNLQVVDLRDGLWEEPKTMRRSSGLTVDDYFDKFMSSRMVSARHAEIQRSQWRRLVSPTLGQLLLRRITLDHVDEWRLILDPQLHTQNDQVYALVRQMFARAVEDGLIESNPARKQPKSRQIRKDKVVLTRGEIQELTGRMPENYQTAIVIGAWCGLRIGEILALRRSDVDMKQGMVKVRRSVARTKGQVMAKPPKSAAGDRDVPIPRSALQAIADHLDKFVAADRDAVLFAGHRGEFLAESSVTRPFRRAVTEMGYPNMVFHELRHTHATMLGRTGASVMEMQVRMGHSTPQAAMIYQHSTKERQIEIAKRLDSMDD